MTIKVQNKRVFAGDGTVLSAGCGSGYMKPHVKFHRRVHPKRSTLLHGNFKNKRDEKVTKVALQKYTFYLKVFAAQLGMLTYKKSPDSDFPYVNTVLFHGIKYLYEIKFVRC